MRSRRPALPAAFAVVLLVAGQLAALAHAAETRHVVCEEHGETLEAVELAGTDDGCEHAHFIGVDGDAGGEHEDCEVLRALHQASAAPGRPAHEVLALVSSDGSPATAPRGPPVAADLYLIAPKTSPPAHAG